MLTTEQIKERLMKLDKDWIEDMGIEQYRESNRILEVTMKQTDMKYVELKDRVEFMSNNYIRDNKINYKYLCTIDDYFEVVSNL